jgi:hypothetical protein
MISRRQFSAAAAAAAFTTAARPQMVDSRTKSPDGLLYTFTLRSELMFHDGSPVTTRDTGSVGNPGSSARVVPTHPPPHTLRTALHHSPPGPDNSSAGVRPASQPWREG